MKRQLLLIAAMVFIAVAHAADGDKFEYNGLNYKVTSENFLTVSVDGSNGASGDIKIPDYAFNGSTRYSVTGIGFAAFRNCTGITSVTIPSSVTKIETYAFEDCAGLTSVSIPNSVTNLGYYVFNGCSSLNSVDIPDSITQIGDYTFAGCRSLTSVNIPGSVTKIGYAAFKECSGLTSIIIPNSVTVIGDYAFRDCSGLTSMTFPNSLTRIGECAFDCCISLTSISIPNSVTEIGFGPFSGCNNLTEITVEDGNKNYSATDGVLFNFDKTILIQFPGAKTEYVIPDSVTEIAESSFVRCSNLVSVTIPDSVTKIGNFAFADCSGLVSIDIPDSVTQIGWHIFERCKSLTSATISDSVTEIKEYAFSSCSSLTSITIPGSVTMIGNAAFSSCNNLTKIYNLNPTPQTLGDCVFSGVPTYAVVYIPKGSLSQYSTAEGWDRFTDFREMGAFDISMSDQSIKMAVGETATLKVDVVKDDEVTVDNSEWTTSDPEVATVDEAGVITAIAPGKAVVSFNVTDSYGLTHTVSCEVTVVISTSVEDIAADAESDSTVEVYTVNGVRISDTIGNIPSGLYIVRQGKTTKKIVIR